MKSLVIYSSLTGNTKQVAEAVAKAMPNSEIFSVEDAPDYKNYDVIAIGYWVDRGMPNKKILDYLETLENATVLLFGTLGAYPHSDHAKDCMQKSEALILEKSSTNIVLGSFLCMGKIDPKILEFMANMPQSAQHPMTEERKARIEEAKKHPNEEDLQKVQDFVNQMLEKYKTL